MIITRLGILLSIFLFIQQDIIFDGFVHIRSHFAHRFLCIFLSVEHILNLCFYNRTCFREYTEKCTCIFRCRIMKLVNGCLELWVFCNVVFEYLLVMCCCCYREVSCLWCSATGRANPTCGCGAARSSPSWVPGSAQTPTCSATPSRS